MALVPLREGFATSVGEESKGSHRQRHALGPMCNLVLVQHAERSTWIKLKLLIVSPQNQCGENIGLAFRSSQSDVTSAVLKNRDKGLD